MQSRNALEIDYAKGLGIDTNESLPEGIPAPPRRPERIPPDGNKIGTNAMIQSTPLCDKSGRVAAVSISPIGLPSQHREQSNNISCQTPSMLPWQRQQAMRISSQDFHGKSRNQMLNFSMDSLNRSYANPNVFELNDNGNLTTQLDEARPRALVQSTLICDSKKLFIATSVISSIHNANNQTSNKNFFSSCTPDFMPGKRKNWPFFSTESSKKSKDLINRNISIDSLNRFKSSSIKIGHADNETFMSDDSRNTELPFQQFESWQTVKTPQRSSGSGGRKTATSTNTMTFSSVNRSNSTFALAPSVIVAVTEGRGLAKGEIGLAAVDLHAPTVLMSQFLDDEIYNTLLTVMQSLNPLQIIIPSTIYERDTVLAENLKTVFETNVVKSFDRKFFNESQGLG